MNRRLILSAFATCLLILTACTSPDPAEDLREQQLRNSEVHQLNISATKNTLIEGERTRLQAIAMIGKSPTNVTRNVTFYVEGPGDVTRQNGNAYYVATGITKDGESVVYATFDPSTFGGTGDPLESNQLNMFVLSRKDHKVTMPSVDSFETNSVGKSSE